MLEIVQHTGFKKDMKRINKSGRHDISLLKDVIIKLASGHRLEMKYRDHYLSGCWNGFRECHIAPDWLLVYRTREKRLELARTGSHSDLFE